MLAIGTKVIETGTGDTGTVDGQNEGWTGGVWVKWETGLDAGQRLHIREEELDVIDEPSVNVHDVIDRPIVNSAKIAECMKILIDAGYIVFKE